MVDTDDTARQTIALFFRIGRTGQNVFKLLKNAMEMYLQGKGGEVNLKTLKNFSNGNLNDFEFSKRSEDDFNIFKDVLKEYGIKYNLKKSNTLNEDGTRDYYIFFDMKDTVIVERAFKEFCKRMDNREEQDLKSKVNEAEKEMKQRNKEQDRTKNKQKTRDKNRDFNPKL